MRTANNNHSQTISVERQKRVDRSFSVFDIDAEDLAPATSELQSALEQDRRGSLQATYEIGQVLEKHYRRLQQQHGNVNWPERGDRFFEQLAVAVDRPASWLRSHFRLVRSYDAVAFDRLCQTPRMTATKALQLSGLEVEARNALIERVADEGLTVRQLDAAIKQKVGYRREPGAGRPPKAPKKLKDAFLHLTKQAEQFVRINNAVWFGRDYDIIQQIHALPLSNLDDDLKSQVLTAATKCEELAVAATKDANALRELLPEIDRRMEAQQQLNAQVENAERRYAEEMAA